jgi:hypothetical protein
MLVLMYQSMRCPVQEDRNMNERSVEVGSNFHMDSRNHGDSPHQTSGAVRRLLLVTWWGKWTRVRRRVFGRSQSLARIVSSDCASCPCACSNCSWPVSVFPNSCTLMEAIPRPLTGKERMVQQQSEEYDVSFLLLYNLSSKRRNDT